MPRLGVALTWRFAIAAVAVFFTAAVAAGKESNVPPATDPAEVGESTVTPNIAVELNRTDSVEAGCRVSFVIRNLTSHAFESMQWDLFFFDPDGLIIGRLAAEAAPLRAGKTSVKLFDLPDLACKDLGRVLINDVLRCEAASDSSGGIDCLGLTIPSSRSQVELVK